MKKAVSAVILMCGFAMATAPQFGSFSWIEANGSRIDVGWFGAPCVKDWDGDGLKDLVLGQFTSGKILFYANSDSNDSPVFTTSSFIQSDGTDISVPSG